MFEKTNFREKMLLKNYSLMFEKNMFGKSC